MIEWGAVADDVTGATDLATNFVTSGRRTVVFFGVPSVDELHSGIEIDAAVIALKSRTAPRKQAEDLTRAAITALERAHAGRLYVKYCSTFDSTSHGNIGPVLDLALEYTGSKVSIVVPSFPDAGRTVYRGYLFVGDQLLSESPMKDHPLTPMRDSSIPRLLSAQTTSQVATMGIEYVRQGAEAVSSRLRELAGGKGEQRTLVVVDATSREDLSTIMEGARDLAVISGGSGLAQGLEPSPNEAQAREITVGHGRRLVLSGSASARTREQVAHMKERQPSRKLDIHRLADDFDGEIKSITESVERWWAEDESCVPLVYSVGSSEDLSSDAHAQDLVEAALGTLAVELVRRGARQMIVAGGESSGRVLGDLQVRSLRIGPIIGPGVAWSEGRLEDGTVLSLALKSGNFGDLEMFETAWGALERLEEEAR